MAQTSLSLKGAFCPTNLPFFLGSRGRLVWLAVFSMTNLLESEGVATMILLPFCVHYDSHEFNLKPKGNIMEATKVGIREFRAGMAEFIASSTPVAVTRHGQTIGYFIPTHGQAEADIASLKKASKTLDRLLA